MTPPQIASVSHSFSTLTPIVRSIAHAATEASALLGGLPNAAEAIRVPGSCRSLCRCVVQTAGRVNR